MRNVPTRVRRWLNTPTGRGYALIKRPTLKAIIRLYDHLTIWLPTVTPVPTPAQNIDTRATLAHLELEIDELRELLSEVEKTGR